MGLRDRETQNIGMWSYVGAGSRGALGGGMKMAQRPVCVRYEKRRTDRSDTRVGNRQPWPPILGQNKRHTTYCWRRVGPLIVIFEQLCYLELDIVHSTLMSLWVLYHLFTNTVRLKYGNVC